MLIETTQIQNLHIIFVRIFPSFEDSGVMYQKNICSEYAQLKWLPGGQTNFYFLWMNCYKKIFTYVFLMKYIQYHNQAICIWVPTRNNTSY